MNEATRLVITVVGEDKVGIIAKVATVLATYQINILDISQTILQEFFTMIMLVDFSAAELDLLELQNILQAKGQEIGVRISVQHEALFKFMHRL